jgi:four helix bundle protein
MQEFKSFWCGDGRTRFALRIHDAVEKFPRNRFGQLKSQLTRAADSIAANIVEGCGSTSQREFARFLAIAIKSASEAEYHLLAALHRGALSLEEHDRLCDEVTRIRKMLFALRKKVLATLDGKRSGNRSGTRPGSAESLSRQSVTEHHQPTTPNQQRQSRDNLEL